MLPVDVVVVGAGPVGLLIAYQVARFGCKPLVVEQEDKLSQQIYGRATTLWPRTVEMLDQIDIAERLLQIGLVTRSGLHFHEGKRVHGGLMYGSRMDKLGDTFMKFALHIRQRLTEDQILEALADYGQEDSVLMQHRFEGFTISEAEDQYPLTVTVRNLVTDKVITVQSKYLVGADGGKSTVRKLAGIPFVGESTANRWIRMDAKISFPDPKAAMPNPRSLNSIDSKSHGQILWCPADCGLTRIGFVFSAALIKKYGGEENLTKEIVVEEAKLALAPFKVNFEEVGWWTLYGIGQRIASVFSVRNRIFLAGDACHTHSSGSAQGLNTGVHDAVNLGWKLAFTIKGHANQTLLSSYDAERHPIVQKVIDNDKTVSTLISGQYPEQFKGRTEPTREILTEWFDDMNRQSFTLGFGISYSETVLNCSDFSSPPRCVINPGERGPDVFLSCIGTEDPIRLHQVLKNDGRFGIVIFAGNPAQTQDFLVSFQSSLSSSDSFINIFPKSIFRLITITCVAGNGGQEVLGIAPFGQGKGCRSKLYFDPQVQAHDIYGVDVNFGAVVVFRPDGWIGMSCPLDGQACSGLRRYFKTFLCY